MLRMASAAGPDPRSLGAFGGGAPFARCRRMSSSAECFTSCRLSVNAFRAASAAARSSGVPASASQTHTCRPTCAFIVTSAPSASPSSPAPAYGDAHRRRHIAARKRAPCARAAARPPGATRTGPRVTQGPAPIAHCAPSNNPPPHPSTRPLSPPTPSGIGSAARARARMPAPRERAPIKTHPSVRRCLPWLQCTYSWMCDAFRFGLRCRNACEQARSIVGSALARVRVPTRPTVMCFEPHGYRRFGFTWG